MPKRIVRMFNQSASKRQRIFDDSDPVEGCSQDWNVNQDSILEPRRTKAGKIVHMHLKNFMCHGNLKLDFNQRINFILGHNGAGKSVILTAAIIGLGGSAKVTNRSSTVGKLIKNGEPSGSIEIHLSNDGIEGYEREKYGNLIVIIRNITSRGASSYLIKNEKKEVVSKSKSVLDLILKYFEITVNNPITVLTQDCARTFLRDSDHKAQFQLFRKGVGLEAIEEELKACNEKNSAICDKLQMWKHTILGKEEELRLLRKKFAFLESAQRAKELIADCELELKWINIREEENILKSLNEELSRSERELNKLRTSIERSSKRNTDIHKNLKEEKEEIQSKRANVMKEKNDLDQMKQEVMDHKNNFLTQRKKFMSARTRIQQSKDDLKKIEQNFENVAHRQQKEDDQNTIKEYEMEKAHLTNRIDEMRDEIENLSTNIEQFHRAMDAIKPQRMDLHRKRDQFKDRLHQLENMSDNLAVYGSHVPKLLQILERNKGRFSKMPIGPIGRYIEVPNVKYRHIVEQIIGSTITGFMVNSSKDEQELLKIFRTEFPSLRPPTIFQRTFRSEVYDVSAHVVRPPRNTTLCFDQIKWKDPNVMNVIIDSCQVERILICDDMQMGRNLTENAENVPKNLKHVTVLEPLCEMYPSPNFRIYMLKKRDCIYIQVSNAERKNQIKQQLEETIEKLNALNEKSKLIEEKSIAAKTKRKEIHTKQTELSRDLSEITDNIAQLSESLAEPHFEEDALIEEKQQLEKRIEELTEDEVREKTKWEELKQVLELKSNEVKDKIKEIESLESEIENLRQKVDSLEEEQSIIVAEKTANSNHVKNVEKDVETHRKRSENKEIEISRLSSEAGPKITTNRTKDEVKDLIISLKSKQKVSCAMKENIHDVKLKIDDTENSKNDLKTKLDVAMQHQEMLKSNIVRHTKKYEERKRVVQKKMSERFKEILGHQNYSGDIQINFEKHVLDIDIHPRQSGTVKGTKSLSGGERSFSTIAFLLSIWSCIEHPFFFLDEYDVFTDGANREIMTKLLIQEAMAKPHIQFLFITPQDMSQLIQPSDELTIFRMPSRD